MLKKSLNSSVMHAQPLQNPHCLPKTLAARDPTHSGHWRRACCNSFEANACPTPSKPLPPTALPTLPNKTLPTHEPLHFADPGPWQRVYLRRFLCFLVVTKLLINASPIHTSRPPKPSPPTKTCSSPPSHRPARTACQTLTAHDPALLADPGPWQRRVY